MRQGKAKANIMLSKFISVIRYINIDSYYFVYCFKWNWFKMVIEIIAYFTRVTKYPIINFNTFITSRYGQLLTDRQKNYHELH